MAIYGQTFYGTQTYGQVSDSTQFDASPFVAQCLDYGTSVVTWHRSGGQWNRQRMLRSTAGFAANETDGVIVLDESGGGYSTTFHDSDLTEGVFYYYTLLLFDTEHQEWKRAGLDSVLIVTDYSMTQRQYDLLPAVFKSPDLQGIGNTISDPDTSIYRFLSLFGFEYDFLRTAYTSLLLQVHDPLRLNANFLPALCADLGISYEPELGARAVRTYIASAIHLYKMKGTAQCVRDLATILTGWSTTISLGKNLVLDNPTAKQNGGCGLWGLEADGVAVAYRPNDEVIQSPFGDGVVEVRVNTPPGPVLTVGAFDDTADAYTQRLYGIPVVQGRVYTASVYMASSKQSVYAALRVTWVDRDGNPLGTSTANPTLVHYNAGFGTRLLVADSAPTGAAFALVDYDLACRSGWAINDTVWHTGFQFEVGIAASQFECARKVHVTLTADLVNTVKNPNALLDVQGWTETGLVLSREQNTTTLQTNFAATITAGTLTALATADASATAVADGQTWTTLASVTDGQATAVLAAGVLRLYANSEHVRDVIGPWMSTAQEAPTQVWATYVVDPSEGVDTIIPGVAFERPGGVAFAAGTVVRYSQVALEATQPEAAFYFDGSVPSATNDYLWEGVPGDSRSHFYRDRTVKALRLLDIIPRYLPMDACFDMLFAQPSSPVYLGGGYIENYDVNPGTPPTAAAPSATFTGVYDIDGSVGRQYIGKWADGGTVNATPYAGRFEVLNAVQATPYVGDFNIAGPTVSAMFTADWNNQGTVTQTFTAQYAVTAPTSVGPSPLAGYSPRYWYDAANYSASTGQWTDEGPNNHTLTPTRGATPGKDSSGAVAFAGGQSFGNTPESSTLPRSGIAVFKIAGAVPSNTAYAIWGAEGNQSLEFRVRQDGNGHTVFDMTAQNVAEVLTGTQPVPYGQFAVGGYTIDASGDVTFYLNGVADSATATYTNFGNAPGNLGCNGSASSGPSEFFVGSMAEVFTSTVCLTAQQMHDAAVYLLNKWSPLAPPTAGVFERFASQADGPLTTTPVGGKTWEQVPQGGAATHWGLATVSGGHAVSPGGNEWGAVYDTGGHVGDWTLCYDATGNDYCTLFFRGTDQNNGLYAEVSTSTGQAYLIERKNGVATQLINYSNAGGSSSGFGVHTLRVVDNGATITLWNDAITIGTCASPSTSDTPGTLVGFHQYDAGGYAVSFGDTSVAITSILNNAGMNLNYDVGTPDMMMDFVVEHDDPVNTGQEWYLFELRWTRSPTVFAGFRFQKSGNGNESTYVTHDHDSSQDILYGSTPIGPGHYRCVIVNSADRTTARYQITSRNPDGSVNNTIYDGNVSGYNSHGTGPGEDGLTGCFIAPPSNTLVDSIVIRPATAADFGTSTP